MILFVCFTVVAHLHLGHAYAARGQVREAVSALVRCASLRLPSGAAGAASPPGAPGGPGAPSAPAGLGGDAPLGAPSALLHAVRDEATHEGARVSALLLLGHLHAAQGRLRAAESAVKEAIQARPEDYQPEVRGPPLLPLLSPHSYSLVG